MTENTPYTYLYYKGELIGRIRTEKDTTIYEMMTDELANLVRNYAYLISGKSEVLTVNLAGSLMN